VIKIWIGLAAQYREVESLGKIMIQGYEDYEFYATAAIEPWNKGLINITEAKTGEIVGTGIDIKQAISAAAIQLGKYTKPEINARIEKRLAEHESEVATNQKGTIPFE